jgi:quinol monooxygenase YgiN
MVAHLFGRLDRLGGMSERKHFRLEYRLRPDVDVDAYLPDVKKFVANMRDHDASHDYTSYRDAKDPRHFVHVGHFDADAVERMQTEDWFKTFTAHLRTLTVAPPEATMLAQVATTR